MEKENFKTEDLVNFGNYLLSEERRGLIINDPEFSKSQKGESLKSVSHADVCNWLDKEGEGKHKLKVGDEVITNRFEENNKPFFLPEMNSYVGKKGIITSVDNCEIYVVFGCGWPASALTLVTKEKEFKKGEPVEGSCFGKDWSVEGKFVGTTSEGLFVIEFNDNIFTYEYCRRPQPKMQKWNVWKGELGLFVKEDGHPCYGAIVHTFELKA